MRNDEIALDHCFDPLQSNDLSFNCSVDRLNPTLLFVRVFVGLLLVAFTWMHVYLHHFDLSCFTAK